MILHNQHIINPEDFRTPSFFISPFSTADLERNNTAFESSSSNTTAITQYESLFGKHEFFLNGKCAINKALSHYQLQPDDEVLILTTSSNWYVSSCVTNEITKFCKWSREKTDNTKLVFVIHEFGKIYQDMEMVKSYQLPIIEDCAMSLFSNNDNHSVGKEGDFAIYSLPKFFPIQFGGILKINRKDFFANHHKPFSDYLKKVTVHFLENSEEISLKRKENNDYLLSELLKYGFQPYFDYTGKETPSVCMFKNNGYDLSQLKIFLQKNGVECSVFYGDDAFFIPVHQNLSRFEMNFIINLIDYFIHETK